MLTFLTILTLYNFIIPKVILLLISLIILRFSFLQLRKDLYPNGYEPLYIFKINNFFFNYILVFTYIIIFIILLFGLRIYRMGFQFDLKPFYYIIIFLINQKEYLIMTLIIINILILMILFLIIITVFRTYLEIHLMKQHLYLSYAHRNNFLKKYAYFYYERFGTYNMYLLLLYFFKKVDYFSLDFFITFRLRRKLNNWPILQKIFKKVEYIFFILISLKGIMLLVLLTILYDIIYNNGVISILYNLLPFLFIYSLWFRFSRFSLDQVELLNKILFDIYYNQPNIKYIGLDYQDNLIISLYIRSGLRLPEDFYWENSTRILPILIYKRYVLIDKEKNIYYNENTKRFLEFKGGE